MMRRWLTTRTSATICAAGLSLALASFAQAQTYTETENNNNRASANPIPPSGTGGIQPGESIGGVTTGSSTTASGTQASADYFRVKIGTAPLAIYQQKFTVTNGTANQNYTVTLRGHSQSSAGVIDTASDASLQSNSTLTAPRFVQWYGFGKGEFVNLRIDGATATSANYQATFSRTTVVPQMTSTTFNAGPITISSVVAGTSTDFWVYNANLEPVATFGNDDNTVVGGGPGTGGSSIATRNLTPGVYYVAISTFNLANDQPFPFDERTSSLMNVWSDPNGVSNSATSTNVNVSFLITDGAQTENVTATKVNPFDVVWVQFTVGASTNISVTPSVNPTTIVPGSTNVTVSLNVTPAPTPPNTITTVTADLSSVGGPSAAPLTNNGGGNYSLVYAVPPYVGPGTRTIDYSVSDNGGRTVTGSVPVTVSPIVPPNDSCSTPFLLTDAALPYSATVGVNLATADTAISCSTATQTNNGIWYQYTPTQDAILKMRETGGRDVSFVVYSAQCANIELYCESNELDANFPVIHDNTYYILVTTPGSASTNLNDAYSITFDRGFAPAPPVNDTCSNALPLVPSPNMQSFGAGGATDDEFTSCITASGVNGARNGIWFTYTTGAQDELVRMHRFNDSQFFSAAFFTAGCGGPEYTCVNLGTAVGTNAIPLHRNTQYWILIHRRSGYMAADGQYQFVFNIDASLTQIPNTDCDGAIPVTSIPFSDTKNNILAFDDPGVPCISGQTLSANSGIWYRYSPVVDTQITYRENSSQEAFIVVYESPDTNCNNRTIYQCDSLSPLTDIDTIQNLRGGRTYFFLVGREPNSDPSPTDVLTFEISRAEPLPAVPANDLCDNAIPITSVPFNDTKFNANAGNDLESSCSAGTITDSSRHGIWYTYTSGPATGTFAVMSESGPEDVIFVVYTGGCNGLTEAFCLDAGSTETETSFPLTPNTTYHILIARRSDTFAAPTDQIIFSFDVQTPPPAPANDNCATAKPLGNFVFVDTPSIFSANADVDVTCSATTVTQTTNGVWYSFTPAGSYTLTFTETNSGLDVQWAIFTGPCDALTEVFCNTTDTGRTFAVTAGTPYYILVGRASTAPAFFSSQYLLQFSAAAGTSGACCSGTNCVSTTIEGCPSNFVAGAVCDAGNPVACCPANFNKVGGITVQDIFDFLAAYFGQSPTADFNRNGSITVQDIFDFLAAYFNGCT